MGFFSRIKIFLKRDERPAAPAAAPAGGGEWRADLTLALRQAEPRLSAWLDIVLAGVDRASEELWERLGFLFQALEAPEAEAEEFVARFRDWLTAMGYSRVEEVPLGAPVPAGPGPGPGG